MKRILHVIDTTGPGGAETVFIELADRLRQADYESYVLIRGPGWVNDELNRRGLNVTILDSKGSANFGYLKALMDFIRSHKIDVIQSHLLGSNLYSAIAGLLTRTPVIATFHGMVDVSSEERFLKAKFFIINHFVRKSVMVSEALLREFANNFGLKSGGATVIYNGIDTADYEREKSARLRNELQIPQDATVVGSLGNIRPAKAYDVLVDAAAKLAENPSNNFHFIIAGDPKASLMEKLKAQIAAHSLEDRIHFVGFVDDIGEYMSNLDLFLLTSKSEGFSISTIEAMASSLPIVTTRCGGPEEILTHEENGLLVENGSASAVAEALERLAGDAALRDKLASNACAAARERYDINAMIAAYTKLYY